MPLETEFVDALRELDVRLQQIEGRRSVPLLGRFAYFLFKYRRFRRLIGRVITNLPLGSGLVMRLATKLLTRGDQLFITSFPTKVPTLHIDVTGLVNTDLNTGIQRVTREITCELFKRQINNPDSQIRFSPFAMNHVTGNLEQCVIDMSDGSISLASTPSRSVVFGPGDVVLVLDLNPPFVALLSANIWRFRERGIIVGGCIYDVLPIEYPHWFPKGVSLAHRQMIESMSDFKFLVCISHDTALRVAEHLEHPPQVIECFRLGRKPKFERKNSSQCDDSNRLRYHPSIYSEFFLSVGTIEPRKGYDNLLNAFEAYCSNGGDTNLVICGRKGWLIDDTLKALRASHLLGDRLFVIHDATDHELQRLYSGCRGLIAASRAEGYGLPLIEAANHKKYVLARDIPVFREVLESNVIFFDSDENLSGALFALDELVKTKPYQDDHLQLPTWECAADDVLEIIAKAVGQK